MAKDKNDTGSWKLAYEVSVKDSDAGPLIKANVQHKPGKVVVTMKGAIPEMTTKQLGGVYLLMNEKLKEINNQDANEAGSHIATLKMIAAYCNELANALSVGQLAERFEEELDD